MRSSVSASRVPYVYKAALAVLLAGLSASCSSSRFQQPVFTGSTENQRQIIGDPNAYADAQQPMPAQVSDNSVTRQDLLPPPPNTTYVASAEAPAYDNDGQSVYGWSAVGGKVVTVAQGESLDNLAVKFGVPGDQILSANQMTSPAQVRAGRIIVIPHRVAMAPDRLKGTAYASVQPQPMPEETDPMTEAAPAAVAFASAGASSYVVQPGETLFSIARKTGMKPTELAAMNGMPTDTLLKIGQTIRLKGSAPQQQVAAVAPAPKMLGAAPKPLGTLTVSAEPKIRLAPPADSAATGKLVMDAPQPPAMPAIPVNRQAAATVTEASASATAAIDDAADAASTDGKSFRWPVRGRIISGFGSKPNGEKNDGINLAVPEGTSVKAVEMGTVIYAGNELAGYGNLILIRHADGWVSAYAHNKDLLVKRGDKVRRGEIVAHAGMTGSVSAPQVHFELRQGAKPVNPLDYLAGA